MRRSPSVITRLPEWTRSPCAWITTAAIIAYGGLSIHMWTSMTGACDLGIFYQGAHGWAFHGWPDSPIKGFSLLGDHFTPLLLLTVPFLWLHDSPLTLMLFEAVLLALSGIPVYVAVRRMHGTAIATVLLTCYLLSFGIQGAVGFPVHEVMFSTPLIAWGIERALAGRWTAAAALIAACVFAKEDMGGLVFVFGLYCLLNRRWRHGLFLMVWGPVWLVVCVKYVIPANNPAGFVYASDYAANLHSDSLGGGLWHLATHPVETVDTLFGNASKRATWLHLLAPVLFLALASPLAMLALPTLVVLMTASRPNVYSWRGYYTTPLMPIVFLGAADGLQHLSSLVRRLGSDTSRKPRRLLPASATAAIALIAIPNSQEQPLLDWFQGEGPLPTRQWTAEADAAIAQIPPGVAVRASNFLAPALLNRDTVTVFDTKAERGTWAIIDVSNPGCGTAPPRAEQYVEALEADDWQVVGIHGPIRVLHKG